MHGLGVYTWKIGDKYIGEVHYGRIHGFGTYTWRTNSKYVGQWKDGRMHGSGVKTDPHGARADTRTRTRFFFPERYVPRCSVRAQVIYSRANGRRASRC